MKAYYGTNVGKIRNNNEDNLIVCELEKYSLFVVADGMGGHKAGEIASSMAVTTIKDSFIRESATPDFKIPRFIIDSINLANKEIFESSHNHDEYLGMGTTITMAVIDKSDNIAYVGNVGDSRTYLIYNNIIRQVTDDHTFVHELLKERKITEEEARNHPKKNVITRAVGSEENVFIDIFELELHDDNILLLCSDGLTNHICDKDILSIITENETDCVNKLIDKANENGGTDNITVIIIYVTGRGELNDR